MKKKEEFETKISPIIFAVLLIIILLMFAIGKRINHNKSNNQSNQITTNTQNK